MLEPCHHKTGHTIFVGTLKVGSSGTENKVKFILIIHCVQNVVLAIHMDGMSMLLSKIEGQMAFRTKLLLKYTLLFVKYHIKIVETCFSVPRLIYFS